MALEEFLIKIVSEFDDSGFKKLEKYEKNADKSTRKLSFSLKNLVKTAFEDNKLAKSIKTSDVAGKFLKFTGMLSTENDIQAAQKPEKSQPVMNMQKNLQKNFAVTDFARKFNFSNILAPVFNKISGGVMSKIFNGNSGTNIIQNKVGQVLKNTAQTKLFSPQISPIWDFKSFNDEKLSLNYSGKNFENFGNFEKSEKSFNSLPSIKNFLIESAGELKNVIPETALPSISSNIVSPDIMNYSSGAVSDNTNNTSTSQDITNSDQVNITVASGAIQINTSSDKPEEIGDEVQIALTNALDDFILKRGYTKAV